ncbi:hypothetical protein TNCV_4422671 [Trichonephila clavipes]|nr:hypothetical protein TNCV_4422671 [Trichonephila clavipes]
MHNDLISDNGTVTTKKGCLPVPTVVVVSWVLIMFSALEQVDIIHSGMVADWAGLVSSHAKPVEVLSQKIMSESNRFPTWSALSLPGNPT